MLYNKRFEEVILDEFNACIDRGTWRIGKDAIILYFTSYRRSYIFEIPFTELSDILEDGYV
jgi:hypothetical protein